ncbi:MAG: hypothetical protein ABH871_02165 [Pseudomonadota bacterium]
MKKSLKKYRETIEGLLVDIAWAQWNRLGVYGAGKKNNCVTDIEAAIAFVAFVGWLDGRLFDNALSWIHEYQAVVSGERLKFFIKDIDDPYFPRCIGAMIESAAATKDSARWKHFLTQLKKTLPKGNNKAGNIFQLSGKKESWVKRDPSFKKWGLAKEQVVLSRKLKRHAEIMHDNAAMRYRYVFGPIARADIFYLMTVASKLGRPLNTSDLTAIIGYHHSSAYRILQDLLRAGIVEAHGETGSKNVRWSLTGEFSLQSAADIDTTLINWMTATQAFIEIIKLIYAVDGIENELVAKHACYESLNAASRMLRESGFLTVPSLPVEPLERYEISDLLVFAVESLQAIIEEMTKK